MERILEKMSLVALLILLVPAIAYAETKAKNECMTEVRLSPNIAKILCDGETSLKPLVCFYTATAGTNRAVAILCSGAKSLAPLACFYTMKHGTNSEVAILCSGVTESNWKDRVACFYDKEKSGSHWSVIMQCATKGKQYIKDL